jgi:hypothetical protein
MRESLNECTRLGCNGLSDLLLLVAHHEDYELQPEKEVLSEEIRESHLHFLHISCLLVLAQERNFHSSSACKISTANWGAPFTYITRLQS